MSPKHDAAVVKYEALCEECGLTWLWIPTSIRSLASVKLSVAQHRRRIIHEVTEIQTKRR